MRIKLFTRENCGNCIQTKELLLSLGITFEEINADTNKELVNQYAPQGNWNLPLALYFEGDDLINVTTGLVNKEIIELPLKPLNELEALAYRTGKNAFELDALAKKAQAEFKALEKIISLKEAINPKPLPDITKFPETLEDECEGCA